jgi:uncharacterized membrane protein
VHKTKRIFITALFSSIIFVANFFVPPPINNLLIAVQAVILAVAALFVGKAGATYVGLIGGVLSALSRPAFGPFTFLFTFLFGVLVDVFFFVFKVSSSQGNVNRNRVMAAMAFSTAIIGFLSYYVVAVNPYPRLLELTPTGLVPMMSVLVIFVGVGSGIAAGYAAAYLWNKYLKNIPL